MIAKTTLEAAALIAFWIASVAVLVAVCVWGAR